MNVVNMKTGTESVESDDGKVETRDDYPYGLRLSLNSEQLKKLGIDTPAVGSMLQLGGMAKVVSSSTYEDEGEEPRSRVELQITDLGMQSSESPAPKTAAETLYGAVGD